MKFDNSGNMLVPETSLSENNNSSKNPKISTDSLGFIHITWTEADNIFYMKLHSNGITNMVEPTTLTSSLSNKNYNFIAIDRSDNIHIGWRQSDSNNLMYT